MATLKNVYLGLQYLKPDAELWLEASAKLVYQRNGFKTPSF